MYGISMENSAYQYHQLSRNDYVPGEYKGVNPNL